MNSILVSRRFPTPPPPFLPDISEGRSADYRALAHLHYRRGHPAIILLTLRAIDPSTGALAGILTISPPILNAPWRAAAFGHPFSSAHPAALAHAANQLVRTISRVIVPPQYRGLGVARSLVRFYLQTPLTPCTEALASMGPFCPFFERAGMRPIPAAVSRRDRALAAVLRRLHIPPYHLVHPGLTRRHLRTRPSLRRALRVWANDSRSTRHRAPHLLAPLAAARLSAPPTVYTYHSHPTRNSPTSHPYIPPTAPAPNVI